MQIKDIAIIVLAVLLIISVLTIIYIGKTKEIKIEDSKEIEKKWLINEKDIPYDLSKADKFEVEQTYICFEPEIRIRKLNDGEFYTLTIKANMSVDGLVRDEVEYYISEDEYEEILKKKEGNTIHKTRYQLYDGDFLREIDIFKGDLAGLAYMETEFDTEDIAKGEAEPSWVIKNVTSDKRYKNGSLARYGIPKD